MCVNLSCLPSCLAKRAVPAAIFNTPIPCVNWLYWILSLENVRPTVFKFISARRRTRYCSLGLPTMLLRRRRKECTLFQLNCKISCELWAILYIPRLMAQFNVYFFHICFYRVCNSIVVHCCFVALPE